jgi:hypothetical protein
MISVIRQLWRRVAPFALVADLSCKQHQSE